MTKWHINPTTLRTEKCKAGVKTCPFKHKITNVSDVGFVNKNLNEFYGNPFNGCEALNSAKMRWVKLRNFQDVIVGDKITDDEMDFVVVEKTDKNVVLVDLFGEDYFLPIKDGAGFKMLV